MVWFQTWFCCWYFWGSHLMFLVIFWQWLKALYWSCPIYPNIRTYHNYFPFWKWQLLSMVYVLYVPVAQPSQKTWESQLTLKWGGTTLNKKQHNTPVWLVNFHEVLGQLIEKTCWEPGFLNPSDPRSAHLCAAQWRAGHSSCVGRWKESTPAPVSSTSLARATCSGDNFVFSIAKYGGCLNKTLVKSGKWGLKQSIPWDFVVIILSHMQSTGRNIIFYSGSKPEKKPSIPTIFYNEPEGKDLHIYWQHCKLRMKWEDVGSWANIFSERPAKWPVLVVSEPKWGTFDHYPCILEILNDVFPTI